MEKYALYFYIAIYLMYVIFTQNFFLVKLHLIILPSYFSKDNKMDVHNMATVFSPNLVHSESTGARRPESIMYEMEWNNRLIEKLIIHVNVIFDNYNF